MLELLAVLNLYFWLLAQFLSDCGGVWSASSVCHLARTLVALVTNPWNIDWLSWNHLAQLFFFLLDPTLPPQVFAVCLVQDSIWELTRHSLRWPYLS